MGERWCVCSLQLKLSKTKLDVDKFGAATYFSHSHAGISFLDANTWQSSTDELNNK